MAKSELKTASVLAFERKLDPSDALFSAGRWDDRDNGAQWPAVSVREKSVRGTISNRLKANAQDPAKLDAQIHFDASATLSIVQRQGLGKLRHVNVQYLWAQERVRNGELKVETVWGEAQPGGSPDKEPHGRGDKRTH